MPQPAEVVVPVRNGDGALHDELERRVVDARGVAAIGHASAGRWQTTTCLFASRNSNGPAGGLVSAIEIDGQFLALEAWQIAGEQRIVDYQRCGAALSSIAVCGLNLDACDRVFRQFLISGA